MHRKHPSTGALTIGVELIGRTWHSPYKLGSHHKVTARHEAGTLTIRTCTVGLPPCALAAASAIHFSSLYSSIDLPFADVEGATSAATPPSGPSLANRAGFCSCAAPDARSCPFWASAGEALGPGWAAESGVDRTEGAALALGLDREGTAAGGCFVGRSRPLDCAARTWSSGDGESNRNGSATKAEAEEHSVLCNTYLLQKWL